MSKISVWSDRTAWIDRIFSDPQLDETEKKKIACLASSGKAFLKDITAVPDGNSKDLAIQYMRLAFYFANKAVEGKGDI